MSYWIFDARVISVDEEREHIGRRMFSGRRDRYEPAARYPRVLYNRRRERQEKKRNERCVEQSRAFARASRDKSVYGEVMGMVRRLGRGGYWIHHRRRYIRGSRLTREYHMPTRWLMLHAYQALYLQRDEGKVLRARSSLVSCLSPSIIK